MNKKITAWEEQNLKGPVKKHTKTLFRLVNKADRKIYMTKHYREVKQYDHNGYCTESYEYYVNKAKPNVLRFKNDPRGNILEERVFTHDGKLRKKIKNRYNNNGNLVESVKTDTRGSTEKTLQYNEQGLPVSETSDWLDTGNNRVNRLSYTTTFSYDNNGNITREFRSYGNDRNETTNYVYDSSGSLIEKYRFDSIQGPVSSFAYSYDDANRLTQKKWLGSDDADSYSYSTEGILEELVQKRKQETLISRYDPSGRATEEITENAGSESSNERKVFSYNNSSNLAEETIHNHKGGTVSRTIYHYDLHEMVIEKREYRGNSILRQIAVYRYDHYQNLVNEWHFQVPGSSDIPYTSPLTDDLLSSDWYSENGDRLKLTGYTKIEISYW
ncbi:MAG: hypothetical protein GY754_13190 [bacterium]|nr:hypothetical protein [bacterium]